MASSSPLAKGHFFAATLLVLFLCLSAYSCGPEPGAPEPEALQPEALQSEAAAQVRSILPVQGEVSQFAAEVAREQYKKAAAPARPVVFTWDFSRKETYTYDLEQAAAHGQERFMGRTDGPGAMKQALRGSGLILVKSQGNGSADLEFKDIRVNLELDLGDKKETIRQTAPAVSYSGLREDGSGLTGGGAHDAWLDMLFPLPGGPLSEGEFVDLPMEIPYNVFGTPLRVKGRSRITLAGYVEIDGRTCARLEAETEISEVETPPDFPGEFRFSMKGISVFYFDIAERVFRSGDMAFLSRSSIKGPALEAPISKDGNNPKSPPIDMADASDNFISVRLE